MKSSDKLLNYLMFDLTSIEVKNGNVENSSLVHSHMINVRMEVMPMIGLDPTKFLSTILSFNKVNFFDDFNKSTHFFKDIS